MDDSRDVAIPGDRRGDEVVRLERRQQADEEKQALHCGCARLWATMTQEYMMERGLGRLGTTIEGPRTEG